MSTLMTRVGEGAGTGGVVTAGPGHRAGCTAGGRRRAAGDPARRADDLHVPRRGRRRGGPEPARGVARPVRRADGLAGAQRAARGQRRRARRRDGGGPGRAAWSGSPSTTGTPACWTRRCPCWTGTASAPPRSSSPTGSAAPTSGTKGRSGRCWTPAGVRELAAAGVEIGSHSATHPHLAGRGRAAAGGRGHGEPRPPGGPAVRAGAGVRLPVRIMDEAARYAVGAAGYQYACAVETPRPTSGRWRCRGSTSGSATAWPG